ncbi:hypothetical protein [Actinomadura macrotermitis]
MWAHHNLHTRLVSVRDPSTRRVIASVPALLLRQVTFHVSRKRRLAVIERGIREVHAHVAGSAGRNAPTSPRSAACSPATSTSVDAPARRDQSPGPDRSPAGPERTVRATAFPPGTPSSVAARVTSGRKAADGHLHFPCRSSRRAG